MVVFFGRHSTRLRGGLSTISSFCFWLCFPESNDALSATMFLPPKARPVNDSATARTRGQDDCPENGAKSTAQTLPGNRYRAGFAAIAGARVIGAIDIGGTKIAAGVVE